MESWIVAITFIIIGTLSALYAHRFGRWWGGLGFYVLKIAPWLNFMGQTRKEAEHQFYESWPLRGYCLFWVLGIQIFAVLIAIGGTVVLFMLITQLITRS